MKKILRNGAALAAIGLLACLALVTGCPPPGTDTIAPVVSATFPVHLSDDVAVNSAISATFSESMDPATIIGANFTVMAGASSVPGTVTYNVPGKMAIFSPTSNLAYGATYTATILTGVKDLDGNALAANRVWTFSTASAGIGGAPVPLGTAGNYVILAKTGISTVPSSVITGDIGLSPAAESFMTGFSQTKATGYSTSTQVIGFMFAADSTPPTPTIMTTAIADMETAYTDAAGRITPDYLNLNSGAIGGLTLSPGLYNWTGTVTIPTDVTIDGGANDVWIFQIAGDLTVSVAVEVILSGGAQAKNIFWQVAGVTALGNTSHFEGVILCQTAISLGTNATMNGRALAQSEVALDQATITKPAL